MNIDILNLVKVNLIRTLEQSFGRFVDKPKSRYYKILIDMKKIELIAEIGVNHNGKLSLAKKLIKKAAMAGADYAKFQIFAAEELAVKNSKKASYQEKNLDKKISQYEMLKKYQISKSDIKNFK